jgi:NAD(P)-dependent dehydrogenase (short-subunit alcohol dehydrogenase family)
MAVIGITGSTDGIGPLRQGCRRRAPRPGEGGTRAKALGGDVALMVGDLARIDDVRRLADQARAAPIATCVHNAGVWVPRSTPRTSADGYETTFAVNVMAPYLLTPCCPRAAGTVALAGPGGDVVPGTSAGHPSSRAPCCPRHLPCLREGRTAHWTQLVFSGVKIFRIADGTIIERTRTVI